MKFDVFAWSEVRSPSDWSNGPDGSLVLKSSAPVALFIEQQGVEALAGFSAAFDVTLSGAYRFRCECPKGARVFFVAGESSAMPSEGVVFTNADRLPMQSGSYFEVKKALREQQVLHSRMMKEIRQSTAELRLARSQSVSARAAANGNGTADAVAPASPSVPDAVS